MTTTPPLSPASTLRELLLDQKSKYCLTYPSSPRSSTEPTRNRSLKRRLTTARLLALPRKPPDTVKTAETLDAVIMSGVTGPARIMAEMRLRGYHVEKDVVLRAVQKWKKREKTVEKLRKQGVVAGKCLAGKSVIPEVREEDAEERALQRILPVVCFEWPTLEDDETVDFTPSSPPARALAITDADLEIKNWDWLSTYFE